MFYNPNNKFYALFCTLFVESALYLVFGIKSIYTLFCVRKEAMCQCLNIHFTSDVKHQLP